MSSGAALYQNKSWKANPGQWDASLRNQGLHEQPYSTLRVADTADPKPKGKQKRVRWEDMGPPGKDGAEKADAEENAKDRKRSTWTRVRAIFRGRRGNSMGRSGSAGSL